MPTYIESVTALSDYYYCYIDDEEIAKISRFSLAAELDFHSFAGP